ncbi:hypothetical protein [Alteribacillus bidgolensis]|uniref:Copper amine oxidase N-terminal domain-containing protein n=1 Tax=Alteribacillus bidgolensis TaxID=930129 RepID=A0A1G8J3L0_9BACI|nr:hypothetical protein [Alteribacillus bidgolensis]SDI25567.1 hypothetical protein SAMN05216352_10618 [Alteribacillus bidgolensis]
MKKKTWFVQVLLLGALVCQTDGAQAAMPFSTETEPPSQEQEVDEEEHVLYIDGQIQTYAGQPIFHEGILYVTAQAAVKALNNKAEIEEDLPYTERSSPYEYLEQNNDIEKINNREVVRVNDLQSFGIKAEWLDNPGRLHLETADLLTVDNLQIGDSMDEVNSHFDVHWNTGYGQPADYIGFYGGMHEFTYTDRYGKKRSGDVPELQLEIKDDELTYIIISSSSYETAKGVTVGDSLFDVRRAHGSEYVEEKADGKTVYIYHVNGGSLWFIADDDRNVERIGLWAFQLEGYER